MAASSCFRPFRARRGAGFTLIELLTVIAIIGILAAILIPTVSKVRQSAKHATNISNVRQWTIANRLHMEDWKGFVPYQGNGTISETEIMNVTPFPGIGVLPWWNALPPYINHKPLAELPAAARPRIGDGTIWVSPLAQENSATPSWAAFTCYGPPRLSNTPASSPANRYVANISKVPDPGRTVLFGETPHFTIALRNGTPYSFVNAITSPNSVGPYNRNGTGTERGGLNGKVALGFFDGSVRTFTGTQIEAHGVSQSAERGNNPDGVIWRMTPN